MSPYITYRVYSQSDPRKWEENQGEARKFDRSGRGSKPRKRYVLNFVIKSTRSHLVCTLQKLCHIPAWASCKTILYQAAFSLCRSSNPSLLSFWFFKIWCSKLLLFFSRIVHFPFTFFLRFYHVTNSCSVNLWRAKLAQKRPQSRSNQVTTLQLTAWEIGEVVKVLPSKGLIKKKKQKQKQT